MLKNVAFDWKEILYTIGFRSLEYNLYEFNSSRIKWSLIPQYPACQTLDVTSYLDFKNNTPLYIYFGFKKATNLYITLHTVDKRKALSKRNLRSDSMGYDGARIEVDTMKPMAQDYYLTISQTIDVENRKGKECRFYPTQDFTSYRDCDEKFVYDQMKDNYNLMPFWAAKNVEEVTKFK